MFPICLVENEEEQLVVNPKALKILDTISQPVVVVAIAGQYRTGKSYLMNRLAGKNHGFPLGSTLRSETKGIWMWCMPHPHKLNHTLVLLDTEGLGYVEKSDHKNDSWIFTLAMLLSSTFIYNSMNTINHQALEQLHFVTELTELIRAKASSTPDEVEDSFQFVSFFPDFVWVVRDFILELVIDGRYITEDEYLEDALKLIPGKHPKIKYSNMPRECIRHFFPKRKCFVFDRPTNDLKALQHLENISEANLDGNFQMQLEKFCSYILTNAKTKTLREGIIVTGNRLETLVVTYVNAINSGEVPCLENAVTTLALFENAEAVRKAADHYSQLMAQRLKLPTDTLQELLSVHAVCERKAITVFMERSFKDNKREFQEQFMANEVFQYFLQSQAAIEESILQLDKALTDGEKALAAVWAKKKAAEKETELLREKQKAQQQMMEDKERSFQENIAQLKEKVEAERQLLLMEQEKMLNHKLKVQEELLTEGFKKKSEALNKEINQLQKEIEATKKEESSVFSQIVGAVGKMVIAAQPGAAKLWDTRMKLFRPHLK
ncbi:guanylate-binding protein 4-like isoform X3 [Carlito syrichta]|uniref:Guanylate-binding protein 4-like isoform X3 n=1 Tax=Carlito syrichta TaxID=1868482 RepID=A0A1U7TU31_CARSF|nr:guanylate-binding protein 4-like isoform X3 [Carlito syrichta]